MESISKSKKDDIIILKMKGRIHHHDTPNFEKELINIIEENNFKLVLDFTQVDYVCSSALGILISLERKVQRKGGDICLVITNSEILKVMQITLLNRVFRIFSHVDDAIRSFER